MVGISILNAAMMWAGTVLSHPGCYNEGDIHRVYTEKDYVYHVWGATKILNSLAEDFRRTGNEGSKETSSIPAGAMPVCSNHFEFRCIHPAPIAIEVASFVGFTAH